MTRQNRWITAICFMMSVLLMPALVTPALAQDPDPRGVGPTGDQGGSRTFAGPGPTGDVAPLWTLDIPQGYAPGAPVVSENRLLVTANSDEFGGNLTVYDLVSGAFLWNHMEVDAFSDPLVAGGRVYLTHDNRIVALSLSDGAALWDITIPGEMSEPESAEMLTGIVASGDTMYASQGETLYALNSETGEELWQRAFEDYTMSFPIIAGSTVVVSSTARESDTAPVTTRLHGISRETGNEVWRRDGHGDAIAYMASFDGSAVLLTGFADAAVLDAATGQMLWNPVDACGPGNTSLDIFGQAYFCAVGDAPLDIATGQPLADTGPVSEGWVPVAATGDLLYIADGTSRIDAVSMSSGDTVWTYDDPAGLGGPVLVTIGTGAAAIQAVDGNGNLTTTIVGDPAVTEEATPVASPAP